MNTILVFLLALIPAVAAATPAEATMAAAANDPAYAGGQVRLTLSDYLALIQKVEAAERRMAEKPPAKDPLVAEVVSQRTRILVKDEDQVGVESVFEVELRGKPTTPVPLPLTGLAAAASIKPEGEASLKRLDGAYLLVAPEPGRYRVAITGSAVVDTTDPAVARIPLAPAAASASLMEIDLDAGLSWACPGAVVAADAVAVGRRTLKLALGKATPYTFEMRREMKPGKAEEVLAHAVVVTFVQLRPDVIERQDVVLYEVSRGSLASFSVPIPEGYELERAATDEGEVPAVVNDGKLVLQRATRLTGIGYLVLSSVLPGGEPSLAGVTPEVPVRARYLALETSVASSVEPTPADRFARVDLSDLPDMILQAASGLDLSAVWRFKGEPAGTTLRVTHLPAAEQEKIVVESRSTTSLLTVDNTLLHRDRVTLRQAGPSLDFSLPAGATLWSAEVNGITVRPVTRGESISIPIPFGAARGSIIEIVSVQERAVPTGRSELDVQAPGLAAPVLFHEWRLLLPEASRYRVVKSDLQASAVPPSSAPVAGAVGGVEGVEESLKYVSENAQLEAPPPSPGGGATLAGMVTDEDGAMLPGVTVRAEAPGIAMVGSTDENGRYALRGLRPGTYDVTAQMDDFGTVTFLGVVVGPGTGVSRRDFTLEIAIVENNITVTSQAPLINRERTMSGSSVPGAIDQPHEFYGKRPKTAKPKDNERQYEQVAQSQAYQQEVANLRQGMVGGVKPVEVAIPETGKVLYLAGALPPERVSVTIEVQKPRK